MNFFKKIFRFPSNEEKPGPKSLSFPEEQSDKININQSKPQEDAGKTSKEDIELKNYFEKYNEMNYDYLYRKVSANLDENINFVNEKTGESFDLILRRLTIVNKYQKINIAVFYLAGMSDNTLLYDAMTETIANNFRYHDELLKTPDEIRDYFDHVNLTIGSVKKTELFGNVFPTLLAGDAVLLIEGVTTAFLLGARGHKERAVEKPSTHATVKGANDSFNETLLTNITLIRRRVRTPNLWVKNFVLGEKSNTNIAVMYIKGVASEAVIAEVEKRIRECRLPNILDTSYLATVLKEKQNSIFPTVYETERPDIAAANLFEGRVIILVDGTPFAAIVPTQLVQSVQSIEDYYHKASIGTFFRLLRFGALMIAIYFPALYICVVHFHSELLPLSLFFNIIGQRLEVPFPSFLEILLMLIGFDLLREAGTRMPAPLGSALSFLGAIIIGESAVSAGLFSSIIVIVVTITGICTLALPGYSLNMTITVLRYLMMFAAALLGFYGVVLFTIVLLIHLTSLRSFGVSYLAPISPFSRTSIVDTMFRLPLKYIFHRKKNISETLPN
jgi:spore germination protein KA